MIGCQHSTGYLVVCFPVMMSSLAKSKQIIWCTLSGTFSKNFLIFDVPQY